MATRTPYAITISLPHDTVWDGQRAAHFMNQMLSGFHYLVFRIKATSRAMVWQILDQLDGDALLIENAVRASYPEATVTVEPFGADELAQEYPLHRAVLKYDQMVETFLAPIVYATDIKSPDPLSHVTEIMGNLQEGERIIYSVFVTGFVSEAFQLGEKQLLRNVYDGTLTGFIDPQKVERYSADLMRVCRIKLAQRMYHTSLFIQVDSPNPQRIAPLLMIDNQIANFDRSQFGVIGRHVDRQKFIHVTSDEIDWHTSGLGEYVAFSEEHKAFSGKYKRQVPFDLILEAREVASLWHLPHNEFTAPTIQWTYRSVRIPSALQGKREGVYVGVNQYAGRDEPIHIPDRASHISIVGKTGVGKTTLMHHLVHQDIAAGRGVAVIDPHGQLVSDILRYSIPREREQDVIVLDLADEDYPIPLNLLSVPAGMDRGNAAGQLMSVLDRLYDFSSTPTVADSMWASLVTLLHEDHATIRDVGRLFKDEQYRDSLLENVTNAAALEFWERFAHLTATEQVIRPVLWRLRSLYGNSVLYPILCHPNTLDFSSIIAQKKILLVSLKAEEARIPSREQYLLGLVLLTQLQQTVMARRPGSDEYYLYVDEVQHFVTTTFDTLLSEARKYGLSLTTANQYLKQLAGHVLDSIMGNVGTMIVFQCGLDDARLLAPYLSPGFDAEHLMHLNKYEAAITTRHHSQSLPAFSMRTLPPDTQNTPLVRAQEREDYLRNLSRKAYIPQSREEVFTWLSARYPARQREAGMVAEIVDFE